MRRETMIALLLAVGGVGPGALEAAPLPPPPPGWRERADAILDMPRHGDLGTYVARFADDVLLLKDHEVVARGRDAARRFLEERQGLRVFVLDVSYGNPIMAVESLNGVPEVTKAGVVYDYGTWARLATYHLDDAGKVDRIEFIENGSYGDRPPPPR